MTHEPPPPYGHPPSEPRLSMLNLVLGGIAFSVAAAMAGAAMRLAGIQTLVGIIAAMATAVAFLILWNLRIHRQPHGLFLCASLLCLGGSAVALAHALYVGDLLNVHADRAGAGPKVALSPPSPPPRHTRSEVSRAPASNSAIPASEPAASAVQKSPEWIAEWRKSQAQAMERYPALGIRDARENKAFVQAYEALRKSNPSYFDEPDWPFRLAQALAERDRWERGDGIIEDQPSEPAPASPDTLDSGSEAR